MACPCFCCRVSDVVESRAAARRSPSAASLRSPSAASSRAERKTADSPGSSTPRPPLAVEPLPGHVLAGVSAKAARASFAETHEAAIAVIGALLRTAAVAAAVRAHLCECCTLE